MSTNLIFAIVFGVVVIALVVWIVTIYRRAKQVSDASDARLNARLYAAAAELPTSSGDQALATPPRAVVAPVPDSVAPVPAPESADAAPTGPKEQRLAELGDLHQRGLISDDELAAARAKILAD
jgi:Short C-terminal domain